MVSTVEVEKMLILLAQHFMLFLDEARQNEDAINIIYSEHMPYNFSATSFLQHTLNSYETAGCRKHLTTKLLQAHFVLAMSRANLQEDIARDREWTMRVRPL